MKPRQIIGLILSFFSIAIIFFGNYLFGLSPEAEVFPWWMLVGALLVIISGIIFGSKFSRRNMTDIEINTDKLFQGFGLIVVSIFFFFSFSYYFDLVAKSIVYLLLVQLAGFLILSVGIDMIKDYYKGKKKQKYEKI